MSQRKIISRLAGRASVDLSAIFGEFLSQMQGAFADIGQHLLNQGLAAVLGGLGSLGGSRFIGDLFNSKYLFSSLSYGHDPRLCLIL